MALLVILTNQVAAATGRSVWHVREAMRIALLSTLKGAHFAPWTVRSAWARMPVDGGRGGECRDDDGTICPCCGRPLPDDQPKPDDLDPLDPQHSPQSGGCERE